MSSMLKNYKPGQILFTEAETSRSIFIIQKGAVSIRKARGKDMIEVAKAQAGEVLGELSFFDRLPRSATAVALTDLDVIEIPFEAMEKIYNAMPSYLKTIVASLADRLRKANETISALQKKLPKQ